MASVWRKTLVYLGLVEDDEYDDYAYDEFEAEEHPPARRQRRPAPAPDGYATAAQGGGGGGRSGGGGGAVVTAMPQAPVSPRFHLVHPSSFNDAQEVGDKFREGFSVIMNLTSADRELGRRLVDFASGLAYGLGGSMQPVAENVFLVTPAGVQVSAEERRRLLEERGFFNQA
ncbi:MAG: cell division protein SepF [Actinomycetota bacterium]